MFDWLKRKETPKSPSSESNSSKGPPIIAALLLSDTRFDANESLKAVRTQAILGNSAKAPRIDTGILSFELGDEQVFVAPMGMPYPWSDLVGPCETSWMWPPGTSALSLKGHKSHVLVTSMSGRRNPISRRATFVQVVGRLATASNVIGVYWPEATLVHYPPIFTEMSKLATPKELPLHLLVDFRGIANDDGTVSCFTTGLEPLGTMEMEFLSLPVEPAEMREWVMNVASYVLDRKQPLPHGDVIGRTNDEKFRITHSESSFGAKGTVVRVSKQ